MYRCVNVLRVYVEKVTESFDIALFNHIGHVDGTTLHLASFGHVSYKGYLIHF